MTFPTVPQVDTFVRANEGPPPSSNWTTARSPGNVVASNAFRNQTDASGGSSAWNVFTAVDCEVQAELGTLIDDTKYFTTAVRLQTANDWTSNMYQFSAGLVAGNDNFEFWKRVATVFTQLGASVSINTNFATGDRIGGRITGSTLEGFVNGWSMGTRTDTDITGAGYCALALDGNTTGATYTGFWAGAYSDGVPMAWLKG